MKNALLTFLFLLFVINLKASDTTKITTHEKVVIKTDPNVGSTEYPVSIQFPDSGIQYRKAYLYMEFGCAPGLKCGEWDYTNHIILKKNGVRYEIARFITPYGFYWNSSMNWKHGWIYDLTDFSYLLHDTFDIIYQHSGYEGNTDRGWTVTLDFYLVNGTPSRVPEGISTLYSVNAPYGNVNNPFDSVVKEKSFTMPTEADMVAFKTIQTGHGMDQQENCSEFCSKERTILLDNQVISQKNVWRDNCGMNSLYPQAGTWLYDRAGWCPGAPVIPDNLFSILNGGSTHKYLIKMQNYANTTGGSANYDLTSFAMYFKDNRFQTDAALEDIISPSTHFDYLRYNPICGAPLIRVKNLGKDTIYRLDFEYGKVGAKAQNIWVPCKIAPFESGTVELEAVHDWTGAGNTFYATITKVNEMSDAYMADNTNYSDIVRSPTHPNKVCIVFKSNNAPSENSYRLKDSKGNLIIERNTFDANTIYRDTVQLGNDICYTFEFSDEGPGPSNNPLNKDGLDWWANTNDGSGYIQLRNGNTNAMLKNFNSDFGTKILYNFQTTFNMGIDKVIDKKSMELNAFPNPGNGFTKLYIETENSTTYHFSVFDSNGKLIRQSNELSGTYNETLNDLSAGIFTLVVMQEGQIHTLKFVVL